MDGERLVSDLNDIRAILGSHIEISDEAFGVKLADLAAVINQSAANESARCLYGQESVWQVLIQIFQDSTKYSYGSNFSHKSVRLLRALLLFVRNIVISNSPPPLVLNDLLRSALCFKNNYPKNDEFFEKTLIVYFQAIANFLASNKIIDPNLSESKEFIELLNSTIDTSRSSFTIPWILILRSIFSNGKDSDTTQNLALFHLLKINSSNSIMSFFLSSFQDIDFDSELDMHELKLVSLLYDVITHESYGKWLNTQQTDVLFEWLKISQLLTTSKEDWDNFQLLALLSWALELFQTYSEESIALIERNKEQLSSDRKGKQTVLVTLIILDIISDLVKYHQAKEFFIHYKILEPLIRLFRCIHENIKATTIKNRDKIVDLEKESNVASESHKFPQAKSLIIEILSSMTHDSFEVQEEVRRLHGLELVLSNCVIDDNNPFIKERSIICLKFLLSNNKENQNFVAQLEAKKPYEDSALQEAGYELNVVDGEIAVKKKKNVEN